ncbi:MAG TPA: DUF2203 domain-containing protein [Planctomycetaceae bacterium]|jgi:hypothetical protein|nr:DUF2203 domain-containing protein [Planctomycetaceae bacterium]
MAKDQKVERRYYTVEQANRSLPLVKAIAADMVAKFAEVKERKDRLDRIRRQKRGKGGGEDLYAEEMNEAEADLEKDLETLQGYIGELGALGIEVKDASRGLIDFYSLLDGREVYLCWLLGEEEVGHWHELEAGFAGRQSVMAGTSKGPHAGDFGGDR